MNVRIDGKTIALNKKNVLGMGGEGTVYKIDQERLAVKVYTNPTKDREKKLKSFVSINPQFSDRVISPKSLVYDTNGMVIGFTMPVMKGGFQEIAYLSNKKFRTNFAVNTRDVCEIFLDGIPTLENIHNQGFVVGDLNDLNELFLERKMYWIDIDSIQFGDFPCLVATENYLDPLLYGVDLSKKPVFTPGNDWYSFAVLLFKSLLLVHPFGGTHKSLNRIATRTAKKITVFDPSVVYPKIAISPDILTDDLLDAFDKYFTGGYRSPFSSSVLADYKNLLRECKYCGTHFPGKKGSCPVCNKKAVIVVQKPANSTNNIEVTEVLRVSGQIILTKVFENSIKILTNEKGIVYLYEKIGKLVPSKKELFSFVPGAKIEMTNSHIFVSEDKKGEIYIFDLTGNLLGKVSTDIFAGKRRAVFATTENYLYRIENSQLKYGQLINGQLEETALRKVMENQTWFWVSPDSKEPYVFGMFQVVRDQMFWMTLEGNFFDISLPKLENTEVLIDISVKFSSTGIFVQRKTQFQGENYLIRNIIDTNGKISFSEKTLLSNRPYPQIHGHIFTSNFAVLATDDGIVQESIKSGDLKVFKDTKKFVDSNNSLIRVAESIVCTRDDQVLQITTKRSLK